MIRPDSHVAVMWVFDVGRGNATFIRTPTNHGLIVDMGASEEFNPPEFIRDQLIRRLDKYTSDEKSAKSKRIAQAVLSHPHHDHVKCCGELEDGKPLSPGLLTCPHDKEDADPDERIDWRRITNAGGTESILEDYKKLYAGRSLPLQTIRVDPVQPAPGDFEYGIYYLRPARSASLHPEDDNKYGNATSIMVYLRIGGHSILFPGDMTPEGMAHVLEEREGVEKRFTRFRNPASQERERWSRETCDQPSLKQLLQEHGLTILLAPHHGLESCYSEDLYHAMRGQKPQLVVLSERRHDSDQDGTVDGRYSSEQGARGLRVELADRCETRRSISTRNDGHIKIVFPGAGAPRVHCDRNPVQLLDKH